MTRPETQMALNRIGSLIASGDLETLADSFAQPLPVFVADQTILLGAAQNVAVNFARQVSEKTDHSVARVVPTILKIEDQTANNAMIVVRWNHLRSDETCMFGMTMRLGLRRRPEDRAIQIELLEVLGTTKPELLGELKELISV